MLSWAQRVCAPPEGTAPTEDLLELYCGNGNFTVPLARNFRSVIATEVSRAAVEAGHHNLAANNVHNVLLVRVDPLRPLASPRVAALGADVECRVRGEVEIWTPGP